jgi:hypothetical protein
MRTLLLLLLMAPLGASAAESTPEQAVSALWNALSNDPGAGADIVTLERIFHEEAVIFGGRYQEGASILRRSAAKDFLKSYQRAGEKGFYECEVSRVIQAYDHFAVAYSVVESRADKNTATVPDFVGVNSIQLYKLGSQWKILSLYYHVEKQGLPIPLDGGRSGKCLA